jgi:YtcA family
MIVREFTKTWLPPLALIGSTGCSRAPSVEFLGTFFPVWMVCILTALAITGLVRTGLARLGLEQKLGPAVLLYPSLMVAISCALWLVFYS